MDTIANQKYHSTMTVSDVAYELGLGRSKAYDIIREAYSTGKPFKVVMIGSQYRVVTQAFFGWLNDSTEAPLW